MTIKRDLTKVALTSIFALTLVSGVVTSIATPTFAILAENQPISTPPTAPPTTPNKHSPVVSTSELPVGAWKMSYSATVTGYDPDLFDNVTVQATGLPRGLSISGCTSSTDVLAGQTNFSCTVNGTPGQTGNFTVTLTAKDNQGNQVVKVVPLRIAAFIYN